jgi:hypothetical protein
LISSCIVNVDQDLDEPWPIEVYDHNGKAYNVTMEPGDIVLYESSTILHGRPFPMKGRYFVSVMNNQFNNVIIIKTVFLIGKYLCTFPTVGSCRNE